MLLIQSLGWRRVAIIIAFSMAIAFVASGPLRPSESARSSSPVPDSLRSAILQALNENAGPEFAIAAVEGPSTPQDGSARRAFRAANAAHDFDVEFTAAGVSIASLAGRNVPLQLMLEDYGRVDQLERAAMRAWESRGTRIERASHDGQVKITEWYVNGPLGLEQGFTLQEPPRGSGPLAITMSVGEEWTVRDHEPGRSVDFIEQRSGTTLTYGELYVFDADRRMLDARLIATSDGVSIQVDDRGARFPVTIDPFVHQQVLTVPGLVAGDEFGFSVAIDNATAVVGVPGRAFRLGNIVSIEENGVAFVFARTGQTWQMQAQLSPPNDPNQLGEQGRRFGHAVAVSGGTIVVTAPFEDVGARVDAGAANVFTFNGSVWSRVQTLERENRTRFGEEAAIDRDTIAIASRTSGDGGLHIFERSVNGSWNPRADVQIAGAHIGAIAMSRNNIVIGLPTLEHVLVAPGPSFSPAVAVFPPDGGPADRFGTSVAIADDVLLVGSPFHQGDIGAGYIFRRSGFNWTFEQKLEPTTMPIKALGSSVAISSEAAHGRVAVLSPGSAFFGGVRNVGDAFVFRHGARGWIQDQTFTLPTAPTAVTALAVTVDAQSATPFLLVGAPVAGGTGTALAFIDTPPAATPPPQPPGGFMPPALLPPNVTGSTVQLNWTAASGATSYRLRAGTAPNASNAFDGNVGAVTTLTAASVPNGSYFVRVHSVGGSGESGPSNEVRVDVGPTSSCTPPIGPTNLRATVNGGLVTLLWNAAPGAVTYVIEAGSAAGLANLATLDVGVGTTFMASAPPGTYFVRVRMRNACGGTATSNEIVVQVS